MGLLVSVLDSLPTIFVSLPTTPSGPMNEYVERARDTRTSTSYDLPGVVEYYITTTWVRGNTEAPGPS